MADTNITIHRQALDEDGFVHCEFSYEGMIYNVVISPRENHPALHSVQVSDSFLSHVGGRGDSLVEALARSHYAQFAKHAIIDGAAHFLPKWDKVRPYGVITTAEGPELVLSDGMKKDSEPQFSSPDAVAEYIAKISPLIIEHLKMAMLGEKARQKPDSVAILGKASFS